MSPSFRKWLQVSVVNLLVVALLGVTLRLKIAFSLPWINQQFLLHGHSHFAFAGWISQVLMTLLVAYLSGKSARNEFPAFRWIFYANLLTAYGMLGGFLVQGYAFWSIFFSTASVLVSYCFAFLFYRRLRQLPDDSGCHGWFKLAVLWNVLSSLGPFALAYMMATHQLLQNWYLASIYFFLHFQYNGWFLFSCMGLLGNQLYRRGLPARVLRQVFRLFAFSCLPAYFLSTLWWPIPFWLYLLVIAAALCQLAGWSILLRGIYYHRLALKEKVPLFSRRLLLLVALAFSIKLCLQASSVIPALSHLAFGFRPIVIGYLHLVLLGVISLFILTYIFTLRGLNTGRLARAGLITFIIGIILNECLLMLQGSKGLVYEEVPGIAVMLLGAALVLFSGVLLLNVGQFFSKDDPNHKSSGSTP